MVIQNEEFDRIKEPEIWQLDWKEWESDYKTKTDLAEWQT